MVFPDHAYVSLEVPDEREFAVADPRGFLKRYTGGMILDENQRVPDMLSYIQGIVDAEDKSALDLNIFDSNRKYLTIISI